MPVNKRFSHHTSRGPGLSIGVQIGLFVLLIALFSTFRLAVIESAPTERESFTASSSLADGPFNHVETWRLPSRFGAIIDVSLGPEGTLVLADGARHVIEVLDPDGRAAATIHAPEDLAVSRSVLVPVALDLDASGSTLDIVWQRFGQPAGTTSERLLEAYLERRAIDGAVLRAAVRMPGGVTQVTDLGRHPTSGDVYVVRGGSALRFIGGDAAVSESVALPSTTLKPEHIVVLESGFVLVGVGFAWLVREDGSAKVLDLGAESRPALAASRMEGGGIGILMAKGSSFLDPGFDADDSLVLAFSSDGERAPLQDLTVRESGVPPPPMSGWPWSLNFAGPHGALTSLLPDGGMVAHRFGPSPLSLFGLDMSAGTAPLTFSVEPLMDSGMEAIAIEGRPGPEGGIVVTSCETEHAPVDASSGCYSELAVAYTLDADGAVRDGDALGAGVADIVVDADGSLYAGFGGAIKWDRRSAEVIEPHVAKLGPLWESPMWDRACECDTGGRLAVSEGTVFTSQPGLRTVVGFQTASGDPVTSIDARAAGGSWPGDIASDSVGHVLTADTGGRSVERWKADGEFTGSMALGAGLAFGPRRITTGTWRDEPVIAALTSDGHVELLAEESGELLARWLPIRADGSSIEARDLTFDSAGRLLFAEWERPDILVFEPLDEAWEPPAPTPGPTPIPPPDACEISVSKIALPLTVVLGDTAEVTLGFSAECPPREGEAIGADVMLIMWPSNEVYENIVWRQKVDFVERWLALVDYGSHRVGAVTRAYRTALPQIIPLDASPTELVATFRSFPGGRLYERDVGNLAAVAHDVLQTEGREGALKVIVLISSVDSHRSGESSFTQLFEDAATARASGILTYAIDLGRSDSALVAFAGSAERTFVKPSPRDLTAIMAHIVREAGLSLSGNLLIDDTMSDDVWYEEGSAMPPAIVGSGVSDLRWTRSVIPSTGLSLTYRVKPLRTGRIPTNLEAIAQYDDVDGVRREVLFPVPMIDVVAPTATPTARPTATPGAIYLPLVARDVCVRPKAQLDVVLAIDVSSSMTGDKLAAARAAARRFIDALELESGRDRAAVIAFDDVAVAVTGLTTNRAMLGGAIDGLSVGRGTRMDRALFASAALLGSPPTRRAEARAAILLLTDGAHTGSTAEVASVADAARRETGAVIWTIGLGPDADARLLRAIADPGSFRFAPDVAALEAVYGALTEEVGCR